MPSIASVLFDFDGVVADTETIFAKFDCALLNDVLQKAGCDSRLDFATVRALAGNSTEIKFNLVAERLGVDLSPYEQEFIDQRTVKRKTLFRDHVAPLGKNITPFINLLAGHHALATNKLLAKLAPDLKLMGIEDLFDIIVTADPPMLRKPEPDILLRAAELLETPAQNCAYIGDNILDIKAAINAGMLPIGFIIEGKEHHSRRIEELLDHGAYIVVDDFMSLKPYLELS